MVQPKNTIKKLAKHVLVDGFHLVLDMEKSQGAWIIDAVSGKTYLDCYGNFGSSALGHNHPKMFSDEKFIKKLISAELEKPANSDIYTVEYVDFVIKFAKLAAPNDFKEHLFFIEGGGPAVDNAIKTAFDWKARKNPYQFQDENLEILHFDYSFHGRTGYALSVTRARNWQKTKFFPRFDWPWVKPPILKFPVNEKEIQRVKIEEEKAIKYIEMIIEKRPYQIAGIIIEPIQGEGGDNHFRARFLNELRRITLNNDVLLIFDEVQTGFGAAGKMWCYKHFSVKPDILVFGKKSQVCGFMTTERIDEVKDNVFRVPGRINSTWGGNLTDMIKCQKILEIMRGDNLIANAAETGEYFLRVLNNLAANHPDFVSNVRGRGFFIAFDMPNKYLRDMLRLTLWEEGLAQLACGEQSIRFRPPLIFTKENVDEAILKIDTSIRVLRANVVGIS